jgi:hypothetical protein
MTINLNKRLSIALFSWNDGDGDKMSKDEVGEIS